MRASSFRQPPVVRVEYRDDVEPDRQTWPGTIPAVAQLLDEGLDPAPGVTLLVGENGSGKSTIIEAIAMAYGLSPEGGSVGARHRTRQSESPLGEWLSVRRGIGHAHWGFFLRAETMHSFYTYLEENPSSGPDVRFHEMSHGESFLSILDTRFRRPGFYCLDEPEAALSFTSTLSLMAVMAQIVRDGGQFVCATHSPVLAALPGARIIEVGDWGMRDTAWDDLDLVVHWRSYLQSPERYLRHVLDDRA